MSSSQSQSYVKVSVWKAVRVPSIEAQTRAGWLGLKDTEVTTSVLVFSRARGARTLTRGNINTTNMDW